MRIGIDLGGTKIEGIALAKDGTEVARHRIPTPKDDYPATLDAIASVVSHLEKETGEKGTVGMGTPGVISPATGLMKNANSVWLNGKPLGTDLARVLEREVRLANDANCFALSEATDGAAREVRVVFGVIVGTGTGGGIVIDRRVLVGPNAVAGEWGHNPLPWPREDEWPGPDCYCGRTGCIETFLSGPGLGRDHIAHGGEQLAPADIAERADGPGPGRRDQPSRPGCDRVGGRYVQPGPSLPYCSQPVGAAHLFRSRGHAAPAPGSRRLERCARRGLALVE
jgi:fructokinase